MPVTQARVGGWLGRAGLELDRVGFQAHAFSTDTGRLLELEAPGILTVGMDWCLQGLVLNRPRVVCP